MSFRSTILRALLPILACCLCAPAVAETISDEDVKLALIYKISRFVTWPTVPDQSREPFKLCLAERTIFDLAQDRFAGRRIRDRDIDVHLLTDSSSDIAETCDVFYMARLKKERVLQFIELAGGKPVLTVSDAPEFARAGGMIGLSMQGKKIAIRINVAAYESSGLIVSSQLLELAELVNDNRKVKR
jgi:hypothetical protein